MKEILLKRLLQTIPVIILVSIFSFLIIHLAPGDPVNMYIKPEMTIEDIEAIREELGLNAGIVEQYISWIKNVFQGELGYSLVNHQSVSEQIMEKLPATVSLMGVSMIFSLLVSIPLGLISGLKRDKITDQIISIFSYIGISIPSFWFALMLIVVFCLNLRLLPNSGMRTLGVESFWDLVKHMILPVLVLSWGNIAVFTRYIRSSTITQLEEEYVLTAKSKGLERMQILVRHVLKNCLLPVITLAGMNFAGLVTGSFIVESVFGWPGMGTLGMNAITSRDYPMIMGFTMLSCLLLILGNLIADILYQIADPRIKQEVGKRHG